MAMGLRFGTLPVDWISRGRTVIGDAYVAYPSFLLDSHTPLLRLPGAISIDYLTADASVVVTNRTYYQRFLIDTDFDKNLLSNLAPEARGNWRKVRAFYQTLARGNGFRDRLGRMWLKSKAFENCPFEIWTQQSDKT